MARALPSVALAVVLLTVALSLHAQNSACQNVRFSDEVLSRFPGAPASCLDVISRGGQQYAVFKAQLEDVRGNTVRLRVKNPDGTHGEIKTLKTKPGRTVLIDGRSHPVSDLAPNQEISAYVRVDQPLIALAPGSDSEPVETVPLSGPEPVRVSSAAHASMPHTASPIGGAALLAQFCLAFALALMVVRRRRK